MFSAKATLSKASSKVAILVFGVLLYAAPNPALAGTTTEDFLKWERKAQESYLQVSISMAATVATQVRPKMAECIDDWYFQNEAKQTERNAEIIALMPKYRSYHPTSLLLAVIESACGKFKQN